LYPSILDPLARSEGGAPQHQYPALVAVMMNQEALLLHVLEFEKHVVYFDAEADFFNSDIDHCLGICQE
jgi:hypothetical protein